MNLSRGSLFFSGSHSGEPSPLCMCPEVTQNYWSRKSRLHQKNDDFLLSSPRILVIFVNGSVWSLCFEGLIFMWEILTSACLIWSLPRERRNWKARFFCTVSSIYTVFALLSVITLVYEFNKLFLNQLNLLIQVGSFEINVSYLHLLGRLDHICQKHWAHRLCNQSWRQTKKYSKFA